MKFTEAASRITGFSISVFGVSWQPFISDVSVAKKLIAFLEDRRVLYSPYEVEIVDHIFMSVIEIRRFLAECAFGQSRYFGHFPYVIGFGSFYNRHR